MFSIFFGCQRFVRNWDPSDNYINAWEDVTWLTWLGDLKHFKRLVGVTDLAVHVFGDLHLIWSLIGEVHASAKHVFISIILELWFISHHLVIKMSWSFMMLNSKWKLQLTYPRNMKYSVKPWASSVEEGRNLITFSFAIGCFPNAWS